MANHTTYAKRILAILLLAAITAAGGCSSDSSRPRTLTIVYSNDLRGEIRSCGCVAKDYGGLGRRATFVRSVRDTTGDLLLVDGGDMFSSELNYGKEKADLTLRSLALTGYHGVVPGETDLGFGVDFLVERARTLKLPVVASNLWDNRADTLLFAPTAEVTLPSGLRVGIVGAMGHRIKLPPQARDAVVTAPVPAIKRHAVELRPRVDIVVLLAHMSRGEVQRLATDVPELDLIIYGHEARPIRKVKRNGNAFTLQVAEQGRYVGVAFAVLGDDPPISRLTAVSAPLSNVYPDDEAISKLFQSYDLNVATREKSNIPTGVLETRAGIERPFVGADACKECHEDIYDQWAGTAHSHAFEILVEKGREYDRDCTPCHTTGFYKHGGFENLGVTPELINVQCESCHGNGYEHANDPDVAPEGDAREACIGCHNSDQSPEFDFRTYWARIAHDGDQAGH